MHEINFGDYDWMQRVGDTIGEMSYWFRAAGYTIPKRDNEEKHFVYVVTDTSNKWNDIVYIGSGQGTRYRHVLSGTSHNRKLNEMFFNKEELHVMMFEDCLSAADSLKLEGS